MTIVESVTELWCRVDDAMPDAPRQTVLAPRARVTLGLLHALKG